MLVLKFGGSSVADRAQIEKVLEIVQRAAERDRIVVVSSAHKGITSALVAAAERAAAGALYPDDVITRQRSIAQALGCQPSLLEPLFQEICDLLRGIHLVGELSPRSVDYISSFGERMSVRVLADFFGREGLAADAHDIWDLGFVTDGAHGSARPLPGFEDRVRAAWAELPADRVAIVTGFIGKDPRGEITTVGRNGSDLTATLLAAALEADEVQIWTDTDGVMTADPSVVSGAQNIPHMRFEEAAELAYFGSRVLHPSTLLPAMDAGIPVRVLNTNRPSHPGTVIQAMTPPNPNRATSIAYKESQCVSTVRTARMFGEVGFLAKVFAALAEHGVSVDLVTTSEVSVSFTTHDGDGLRAAMPQLATLGEVTLEEGRTILAIVGQHLAESPGIGARVLGAIATAGANVEMISYARGSLNLQMVIRDEDIAPAVETLHEMLFRPSDD